MSNYSNCSKQIPSTKSQKFFESLGHWTLFRSIRLIRIIRLIFLSLFFIFYFLFFISPVNAVCPVCTVAVGGGVLLSRYLGVDDLIIGVWVGGLIISMGLWTATYFKRKFIFGQDWLWTIFLWITTVFGLKQAGFIGHPTCKIHGHDKLLSGIVFGTIAFFIGYGLDLVLRKFNKREPQKALFPYQRVVLPIALLIITTIFAMQLCRWGIR